MYGPLALPRFHIHLLTFFIFYHLTLADKAHSRIRRSILAVRTIIIHSTQRILPATIGYEGTGTASST